MNSYHKWEITGFVWNLQEHPLFSTDFRVCQTYSSCAGCLCLQSYFWVRRILWLLKMTEKQNQRICIKFCFQLGKTSSETIQMMQKPFGNECMSKTRIKEWCNRLKGGRTSVDSDSRSGRPSTTKTLDNIERVRLAIQGERRLTVCELENDLGIPKTTVHSPLWLLAVSKTQKTTQRTAIRWQNDGWK